MCLRITSFMNIQSENYISCIHLKKDMENQKQLNDIDRNECVLIYRQAKC